MTCSVCSHQDRTDIEVRLTQGDNLSAIAEFFELSLAALQRHQADHLRGVPVKLRTDPLSTIHDLERLEQEGWIQLELAKGRQEHSKHPTSRDALAAIGEIRAIKMSMLTAAEKLQMFKNDAVTKAGLQQVIDRVMRALESHPAALAAVRSALEEIG